eukprot:g1015.t1
MLRRSASRCLTVPVLGLCGVLSPSLLSAPYFVAHLLAMLAWRQRGKSLPWRARVTLGCYSAACVTVSLVFTMSTAARAALPTDAARLLGVWPWEAHGYRAVWFLLSQLALLLLLLPPPSEAGRRARAMGRTPARMPSAQLRTTLLPDWDLSLEWFRVWLRGVGKRRFFQRTLFSGACIAWAYAFPSWLTWAHLLVAVAELSLHEYEYLPVWPQPESHAAGRHGHARSRNAVPFWIRMLQHERAHAVVHTYSILILLVQYGFCVAAVDGGGVLWRMFGVSVRSQMLGGWALHFAAAPADAFLDTPRHRHRFDRGNRWTFAKLWWLVQVRWRLCLARMKTFAFPSFGWDEAVILFLFAVVLTDEPSIINVVYLAFASTFVLHSKTSWRSRHCRVLVCFAACTMLMGFLCSVLGNVIPQSSRDRIEDLGIGFSDLSADTTQSLWSSYTMRLNLFVWAITTAQLAIHLKDARKGRVRRKDKVLPDPSKVDRRSVSLASVLKNIFAQKKVLKIFWRVASYVLFIVLALSYEKPDLGVCQQSSGTAASAQQAGQSVTSVTVVGMCQLIIFVLCVYAEMSPTARVHKLLHFERRFLLVLIFEVVVLCARYAFQLTWLRKGTSERYERSVLHEYLQLGEIGLCGYEASARFIRFLPVMICVYAVKTTMHVHATDRQDAKHEEWSRRTMAGDPVPHIFPSRFVRVFKACFQRPNGAIFTLVITFYEVCKDVNLSGAVYFVALLVLLGMYSDALSTPYPGISCMLVKWVLPGYHRDQNGKLDDVTHFQLTLSVLGTSHGDTNRLFLRGIRSFDAKAADASLIIIVYIVFGSSYVYDKGTAQGGLADQLSKNQFSEALVLSLITQLGFLAWERLAHQLRSVLLKVLMQYVTVIVVHYEVWNMHSKNGVYLWERQAVVYYYLLQCVFLTLSAQQIYYGYPVFSHDFSLTRRGFSMYPWKAHQVFMAVPFAFEAKAFLDFLCSQTSLDVYMFIQIEEIYSRLFLNACNMQYRHDDRVTLLGNRPQPPYMKLAFGFLPFLLITFLLVAPMVLFSAVSPVVSKNSITEASVALQLVGVGYPIVVWGARVTADAGAQAGIQSYVRQVDEPTLKANVEASEVTTFVQFPTDALTEFRVPAPTLERIKQNLKDLH